MEYKNLKNCYNQCVKINSHRWSRLTQACVLSSSTDSKKSHYSKKPQSVNKNCAHSYKELGKVDVKKHLASLGSDIAGVEFFKDRNFPFNFQDFSTVQNFQKKLKSQGKKHALQSEIHDFFQYLLHKERFVKSNPNESEIESKKLGKDNVEKEQTSHSVSFKGAQVPLYFDEKYDNEELKSSLKQPNTTEGYFPEWLFHYHTSSVDIVPVFMMSDVDVNNHIHDQPPPDSGYPPSNPDNAAIITEEKPVVGSNNLTDREHAELQAIAEQNHSENVEPPGPFSTLVFPGENNEPQSSCNGDITENLDDDPDETSVMYMPGAYSVSNLSDERNGISFDGNSIEENGENSQINISDDISERDLYDGSNDGAAELLENVVGATGVSCLQDSSAPRDLPPASGDPPRNNFWDVCTDPTVIPPMLSKSVQREAQSRHPAGTTCIYNRQGHGNCPQSHDGQCLELENSSLSEEGEQQVAGSVVQDNRFQAHDGQHLELENFSPSGIERQVAASGWSVDQDNRSQAHEGQRLDQENFSLSGVGEQQVAVSRLEDQDNLCHWYSSNTDSLEAHLQILENLSATKVIGGDKEQTKRFLSRLMSGHLYSDHCGVIICPRLQTLVGQGSSEFRCGKQFEYIELCHLGSGGYGEVHLCEAVIRNDHFQQERIQFVKKTVKMKTDNGEWVFHEQEVLLYLELAERLPNMVEFMGIIRDGQNQVCMFFEFARGGSLRDWIAHLPRLSHIDSCGRNRIFYQMRDVIHQLLSCAADLHRNGRAHFDIKARNALFRSPSQEGCSLVLADTGSVKCREDICRGRPIKMYNGTAVFRPPEFQDLLAFALLTFQDLVLYDSWCLGCTVYKTLTGKHLWQDEKIALEQQYGRRTLQEELMKFISAEGWRVCEKINDLDQSEHILSAQIVYLLSQLLEYDACDRITPAQALQSPLFNAYLPRIPNVVEEVDCEQGTMTGANRESEDQNVNMCTTSRRFPAYPPRIPNVVEEVDCEQGTMTGANRESEDQSVNICTTPRRFPAYLPRIPNVVGEVDCEQGTMTGTNRESEDQSVNICTTSRRFPGHNYRKLAVFYAKPEHNWVPIYTKYFDKTAGLHPNEICRRPCFLKQLELHVEGYENGYCLYKRHYVNGNHVLVNAGRFYENTNLYLKLVK